MRTSRWPLKSGHGSRRNVDLPQACTARPCCASDGRCARGRAKPRPAVLLVVPRLLIGRVDEIAASPGSKMRCSPETESKAVPPTDTFDKRRLILKHGSCLPKQQSVAFSRPIQLIDLALDLLQALAAQNMGGQTSSSTVPRLCGDKTLGPRCSVHVCHVTDLLCLTLSWCSKQFLNGSRMPSSTGLGSASPFKRDLTRC